MRATVVIFPGSNADAEMIRTLQIVTGKAPAVAWHRDGELPSGTDLVVLPGGFSYGDYLRCGAIARTSPIVGAIARHAERGGYVLGVCNGFQILTEAKLLPGALTQNERLRFECRDVFVRREGDGAFSRGLPSVLRLPIAHAEGRYQADAETLARLQGEGLIAFRYVDADGSITAGSNPNGSLDDIAGVYGGPSRNILGLMPHPERASEPRQGGDDGRGLFESVLAVVGEGQAKVA